MFRHPTDIRPVIGILLITLALTACKGLFQSEKPALNVWWLQPLTVAPRVEDAVAPATLVLDFTVVPGLDTERILALSSDAQLKPYAGARWADALPDLIASLVSRSLQGSGRFEVVEHGRAGAAAPACKMQLELSEFFADIDPGGRTRGVSVGIAGNYRCGAAQARELKSRAHVGVDAQGMSAIVAAFQKALDQVTLDVIKQMDIKQ